MMSDLVALIIAIVGAIAATLLFLIGSVAIFHPKHREKIVATVQKLLTEGIHPPLLLERAKENPILPQSTLSFEAEGVFNPGAVIDTDNRVHLFYRAVGNDGVSRIGYASSANGIRIDEHLERPVFQLPRGMDPLRETFLRSMLRFTQPGLVASGGSFAGTEDPRAVSIGDRVYVSFSAFYSWNSLRITVISLSLEDLRARRFAWSAPVFLSPPNQVQKNWVLFPEKIHGKYAVLHGLKRGDRGTALISYLDSLVEEPESYIESDSAFRNERDDASWDTMIRGAGAPPLLTSAGWLLLYHATDHTEPHKYKVGALLLDRDDPSKVLLRSNAPLLTPDAPYENNGAKAGVVYVCGAVVREGTLLVYYGGSDSVVCVATTPIQLFLEELQKTGIQS